jgi:hypothetical protein
MSWFLLINVGNLFLVLALLASYFLKKNWQKLLTLLFFSLLLKFKPGIDPENLVFFLSGLSGIFLGKRLPFKTKMNLIVSIVFSLLFLNIVLKLI